MRKNPLYRQDYGSGGPPPPPPAPSAFNAPPPPPPPSTGGPSESASSAAITALILGIVSWVCSLGFLTGIPAWIVGKKEIKAIEEGRSPQAGKVMAQIGMWLGIVSVILSVLAIIFFIIYFVFIVGLAALSN